MTVDGSSLRAMACKTMVGFRSLGSVYRFADSTNP